MEILFGLLLLVFIGKIIKIALKATWGITKILVTIVLFPIVLIVMVYIGLIYLALPILVIAGIIALVNR